MPSKPPIIVWFRQDLRLADNPALNAAAESGAPVVLVHVLDDAGAGAWPHGGASRWWLHHSLEALGSDLVARGAPLVLRRGSAAAELDALAAATGATAVFWNRCYEPAIRKRDEAIKADLETRGIQARSFNASLLFEPWTIANQSGQPFKVYTPFGKACRAAPAPALPVPAPARLRALADPPPGLALADLGLLPRKPDWAGGLRAAWRPGEAGAQARLERFLAAAIEGYKEDRNRPDLESTSRLSPHLHFGEISPRQLWHAARGREGRGAEHFVSELLWREFSYHLLFHFPELPERNWRASFDAFPWADDPAALEAWRRGRTGYPIVDAGMRELWQTGWMHNRVRMIAGSFLVKDLMLPWQRGKEWFWDTLVDADLANNAASWQWVAGCGADAAPYFRVFNPTLQGEKFDPAGDYVRRYVPELARMPAAFIHRPWDADAATLRAAGVELGRSYPRPIVDHGKARDRALAAFATLKQSA
jgi:deoxyribodipyrimidine photo-lyase